MRANGSLGFVSTGGGGVPTGGGASIDLSSLWSWFQPSAAAGGGAAPAGNSSAVTGTLSEWSRRLRELIASEDAIMSAPDPYAAAGGGAAPAASTSESVIAWLRANQTAVLLASAAAVGLMIVTRKRGR